MNLSDVNKLYTVANMKAWLFIVAMETLAGWLATRMLKTDVYYLTLLCQTYAIFGIGMVFANKTALHNNLIELLTLDIIVQWFGLVAQQLGINQMYFLILNDTVLILKFWRISMRSTWPQLGLVCFLTGRKNSDRPPAITFRHFVLICATSALAACLLYNTWGELIKILGYVVLALLLKALGEEFDEREKTQFLDLSRLQMADRVAVKALIANLEKKQPDDEPLK